MTTSTLREADSIVRVAKILCRRAAKECNIDYEDNWKTYGEMYLGDAREVVAALSQEGDSTAPASEPTDDEIISIYEEWDQRPGSTHAQLIKAGYALALRRAAPQTPSPVAPEPTREREALPPKQCPYLLPAGIERCQNCDCEKARLP